MSQLLFPIYREVQMMGAVTILSSRDGSFWLQVNHLSLFNGMETRGFEPLTSAVRSQRSTS